MAKLVAVCRSDDYRFERRQLPLPVDDKLKMVVQFYDTCVGCNQISIKQQELERFVQKFHTLTNDDVAVAMMVTSKEIFSLLAQMVPCVGCRRSVEKMFGELVDCGYPALEPLIITKTAVMSLKREVLFDPMAIYALFYIHGSKLNTVMDAIPKNRKNRRCMLHSLDTHKIRSLGSWIDVWDVLSQDCREEVVLIECDSLMDTLENYLRKHRFCSECKSKVLRAYSILVGDLDSNTEKGYCQALYEGLRCCHDERHLHVLCETDFIARLIGRAEPELTGRRERHAKTLDIAQEEVLTCLGIHLYERLHKIWQKLRAEEQTWQILFYLGVDALRKNFEVALEKKQGISNLELMYRELLEEEQAAEQKKEQKRLKKKKKKNKGKQDADDLDPEKDKENCKCDENTNNTSAMCASCDEQHGKHVTNNKTTSLSSQPVVNGKGSTCSGGGGCCCCSGGVGGGGGGGGRCGGAAGKLQCRNGSSSVSGEAPTIRSSSRTSPPASSECECDKRCQRQKGGGVAAVGGRGSSVVGVGGGAGGDNKDSGGLSSSGSSGRSDCGYSSGHEGCDSCSMPSSNDGSDVACSEGICNHGDSPLCHHHHHHTELPEVCIDCLESCESKTCVNTTCATHSTAEVNGGSQPKYGMSLSLQDMLEASCSSGEDEDFISEEEIQRFKANQKTLNSKRQELRATLRQRFNNMTGRCVCPPERQGAAANGAAVINDAVAPRTPAADRSTKATKHLASKVNKMALK